MSQDWYTEQDATGLARLIARGEVSPAEATEAAIAIVERRDPVLNAVVHKAWDAARAAAAGPLPEGPFRGVPYLVKDLGAPVAGMPRTSGSRWLAHEVPAADGELVRRTRAAGVVILGKTNTPELGITGTTEGALLGPCRNPWNPDHIAGGSSGGAAAAVASGMVPVAHASDGLGSIRIPAACCGLFGLKVTRDRNPAAPDHGERATGFAVDHVVSRTVRDSAVFLDATGNPEAAAPFAPPPKARPYVEEVGAPPGRLRVAFSSETPRGVAIDPEVRAALEETARLLEDLGHVVEERAIPVDWRAFYRAQRAVSGASMLAGHAELVAAMGRPPREDELEPLTWSMLEGARRISAEDVMRGWRTLRRLSAEALAFFEDWDVFLSPVMGTLPPRIGHLSPVKNPPPLVNQRLAECFPFTPPANFTGQPAMSVPLAWSASGLPIGMQFAARYGDEATLFRLAAQLEAARPWAGRRPPVWG
jgi:amidase